MNIGIDIRPMMSLPRTGIGEYTLELLDAIFKIDNKNQYFLYYNSQSNISFSLPKWKYKNVKIIHTKYPNKFLNRSMKFFGIPKIDKIIAKKAKIQKLDIFFAPNIGFIKLSSTPKNILTIHDLSFEFFKEFFNIKRYFWHKELSPKKQCRLADIILTPSQNTKQDLINYYKISPTKINVIYPGLFKCQSINTTLSNPHNNIKLLLPKKFILFLGTIEPRKNIIGLIEAFEKINSNHSLVIAGATGWKNKKIYKRILNSPKKGKIQLLGFVASENKKFLYKSADLFVYPSFYEGFGFPVLEAMSVGTPVITSNLSSLPEISSSAAYLIDPTRPMQITLAINELLSNQELRNWHIQKGFKQVEKFSWQRSATEWLRLINNL